LKRLAVEFCVVVDELNGRRNCDCILSVQSVDLHVARIPTWRLGNASAAVQYYSRGLQLNPNNDGLLARGILLYGRSERAIADLERAVQIGSPVVGPYLFLAHQYLATRRFEDCRSMCELGVRMRGSDNAKSQLEEWRAIAQAELNFPPEAVRAAFEKAVQLDPSNDLARRNQDSFEASIAGVGAVLALRRRFALAAYWNGLHRRIAPAQQGAWVGQSSDRGLLNG
jgi:tetratricopeptide (TPR) repeat protein